ncbi:Gfo/Idh/MocA family protein [Shimia ponticola]|uniref:Gfo/Idh/MocA family protein n=1 Tax=Shimia ponticola TaxID=2582893 RepID=UPI0011BDDBB8|nr:Gfo/Idh/MocA family oxidoreductase [Shimia ponticola]
MKWGLIGASTIASEQMIGAIRSVTGNTITSVLSSSAARGADYAKAHDIDHGTADLDDLLGRCDAVYISTTNEKHKDQALAAIAAGKHVLCEKPLAMTVADAVEMVNAAKSAGVVFGTNHHLRCMGIHRRIRDMVQGGDIGDVLSARIFHAVMLPEALRGWRINDASAGGGVVADITVHDADTLRFHLGEDPAEVVAMTAAQGLGNGVEDGCMSVWTMPSGAMVQDHVSFTHPFAGNGIEIHGTKGSIRAQSAMSVMWLQGGGTFELTDKDGTRMVGAEGGSPYDYAADRFTAACRGEGAPAADGVDGIKSLAVAMAVVTAAQSGHRTAVDYGGV